MFYSSARTTVDATQLKLAAANDEVERYEAEVDTLGTIDNLNDEKQRLSAASREKKAEMAQLKVRYGEPINAPCSNCPLLCLDRSEKHQHREESD